MGQIMLFSGVACVVVGIVLFIVYLIAGKAAGSKLRKKLMEEY